MPYTVVKDLKACPIAKPWAVKNTETGSVNGRCHPTKAKARDQQKALYAALRKEGKLSEYFLAEVSKMFGDAKVPTVEDNVRWVQAFPYDTWSHPIYGETTVTPQVAEQFVKNFKDNVRGQDIATNFDHGEDKSKGNKASGWIRDVEARQDGFYVQVAFTPTAVEELKNGEWRYFSSECFDTWTHPHTGEEYQHVLVGGALTNKPWVKGMLPINFSEVLTEKDLEEVEKQFAVWSTSYVNDLPDSNFLFIESGGKKDSEGKTTPRSLRHLPFKDANGKVDEAHVRNAISRTPQMVGLSESVKKSLQARAERVLATLKKMAELPEEEQAKFADWALELAFGESKGWEHSEPGSGSPPAPRIDGTDGSTELDRTGGFRRPDLPEGFPDTSKDTPGITGNQSSFTESSATSALKTAIEQCKKYIATDPSDKADAEMWLADSEALVNKSISEMGYSDVRSMLSSLPYGARYVKDKQDTEGGVSYMGELTEKDVQKLMTFFEVDDEGKLVEAAQIKFGELQELQRANAVQDQETKFAEQYPEMWDEHNKLMEQTRDREANAFSESVSRIRKQDGFALKETRQGLTSKAKSEIAGLHKKFSEKKATAKEFEEVITTIVNGGIIEFGERGATKEGEGDTDVPTFDATASGIAGARQMFGELVQKELDSHAAEWGELPYNDRLMKASDEVAKKHPDLADVYRQTVSA